VLCYYNRLAVDDFHFMSNLNNYGVIGGTIYEYDTWNTRFTAIFLNLLVLKLNMYTCWALFIYGLCSILVFFTSIFLFLKSIFKLLTIDVNKLLQLNLAIFVVNAIFFCTFKIDETWFWLNTSCMYLWSVMLIFPGVAWILYQGRNIVLAIFACLTFGFIGGASEPIAIMVCVLLAVFIICVFFKWIQISVPRNTLIIRSTIALFFCLTTFSILYFGEGLKVRSSTFQSISVFSSLVLNLKLCYLIIIHRLPTMILFVLAFTFPAIFLGCKYLKSIYNPWRKIFFLTIIYLTIIYLHQLSITYITQDVGAYRALFPMTIYTILYFSLIWFIIGNKVRIGKKVLKYIFVSLLAVSSLLNTYTLFQQKIHVTKYANAYDQRMKEILQNQNKDTLLILKPLPPSGFLYSAEISTDTNYFANRHMKEGLNLKCKIMANSGIHN